MKQDQFRFDFAVAALADSKRIEIGAAPTKSLDEAVVGVLRSIAIDSLSKLQRVPAPGDLSSSKATALVCFMAACQTGLVVPLRAQGAVVDARATLVDAVLSTLLLYGPNASAEIAASGIREFQALAVRAAESGNVQEWLQSVQQSTELYIRSKDERLLDALGKLLQSLLGATTDDGNESTAA